MMTNIHRTLYVGVTNDLVRRVHEHRSGLIPGFTKRYGLHMLVWFQDTGDIYEALTQEKVIKAWRRDKKISLIEAVNPDWRDLSEEWFDKSTDSSPSSGLGPDSASE